MATLGELITRVTTRLSMVTGPAVQLYAEDQIAEAIQHKFTVVRDKLWWDEYMVYQQLTLDADGRPVENVVRVLPESPVGDEIVINKYADIQYIWHERYRDPMKSWVRRANPGPHMFNAHPRYHMSDRQKVFRCIPYGTGTRVMVRYKEYFDTFLPDDEVPMDDQVLILGACYDYLEDDGTNPSQIEKFRTFYNERLDQLCDEENDKEIPLMPAASYSTSGYQVVN